MAHHQVPGVSQGVLGGDGKDRAAHDITCDEGADWHGIYSSENARTRSNSVTSPTRREFSMTGSAPMFL